MMIVGRNMNRNRKLEMIIRKKIKSKKRETGELTGTVRSEE